MKRTKRPLALLLTLLMIFALCACGGKSDSAPAAAAAPAKDEASAPAAEKPGVGKYGIRYLELSQDYMEDLFAQYGASTKPGVGSRKLTPEDMEDWYIELKNDGTGYLYWGDDNQGPIDEWKLDGEKLTFKAGVSDFDCSLKDGLMCVTIDDGYDMYFAEVGTKLPKFELISMDEYIDLLYDDGSGEAEPEAPEEPEEAAKPAKPEKEAEPAAPEEAPAPVSEKKVKPAKEKGTQEITTDAGVLYEGEGLRVTATGKCVDDPAHGLKIAIQVENNTDANYLLGCKPVFINGCAASAYIEEKSIDEAGFTTVDAHSTLDCYICTELKDVRPLGIDQVARLDCGIEFINADDWFADHPSAGAFTIITSLAEGYTEPAAPKGKELYNAEGVRVYCLEESPAPGGEMGLTAAALLYVENDSDLSVAFVPVTTYVNGEKIFGIASLDLLPGTRGASPLYFYESSLEENNIKQIDSIECEFWVQFKNSDDSMDHLTKTELISIPVA